MDQETIERLNELGIHTLQEPANVDPVSLLFRTNFPPKVALDWIDQAILYNYVGEVAGALRGRSVRGAIELAAVRGEENDDLWRDVAGVLKITQNEAKYLVEMLRWDHQVRLVWRIWDAFRDSDELSEDSDDEDEGENGATEDGQAGKGNAGGEEAGGMGVAVNDEADAPSHRSSPSEDHRSPDTGPGGERP